MSQLYIVTALETQEQTKLLKTTVHINFILLGLVGIHLSCWRGGIFYDCASAYPAPNLGLPSTVLISQYHMGRPPRSSKIRFTVLHKARNFCKSTLGARGLSCAVSGFGEVFKPASPLVWRASEKWREERREEPVSSFTNTSVHPLPRRLPKKWQMLKCQNVPCRRISYSTLRFFFVSSFRKPSD